MRRGSDSPEVSPNLAAAIIAAVQAYVDEEASALSPQETARARRPAAWQRTEDSASSRGPSWRGRDWRGRR